MQKSLLRGDGYDRSSVREQDRLTQLQVPVAQRQSLTLEGGQREVGALEEFDDGFRIVASYPELKNKPIVIGESDPEGCAACQGPQLAYRNGTMYSSYTAASFARKHELADKHGARDTTARGISPLFDILRFHEGPLAEIIAYGHYHETYEKITGAWRIKTSRLTRLRVDSIPRQS